MNATETPRGKKSFILHVTYLSIFVLVIGTMLGIGIHLDVRSGAVSFNPDTDSAYSQAQLNIVSTNPNDLLNVQISVNPLTDSYTVDVLPTTSTGQPDLSTRFAIISTTVFPNTAVISKVTGPNLTQKVRVFRPSSGLCENEKAKFETFTCPPETYQSAILGPYDRTGRDRKLHQYGGAGNIYMSTNPLAIGSTTTSIYLPAIDIGGFNTDTLPDSWKDAGSDTHTGPSTAQRESTISYCVELPPGFVVEQSTLPLSYTTPRPTGGAPCGAFFQTARYYKTVASYSEGLRVDLQNLQTAGRANSQAIVGGVLIGTSTSFFVALLFDEVSRRRRTRQA